MYGNRRTNSGTVYCSNSGISGYVFVFINLIIERAVVTVNKTLTEISPP